ncbi:MAG: 50S ribosomal protein L19 [Verrucomicrobiales bacterium]|jgi:large subunit ribosomal protein L19|nr:50S ribosomal protein L19 [Verrucomicrobiales bacterium]
MNVIDKIEREQMKTEVPNFRPGDTVNVHARVVEGGKERIQIFKGLIIGCHGSGINASLTVRKISSGEGVERSFHVHSPKTAKIEILKNGKVRRAKLNYLRARLGKAATNLKPRAVKPKKA